jgi:hypothetical protein
MPTNPKISKFDILRETFIDDEGLFRYKIYFVNGDMLEAYQKFRLDSEKIIPVRYSFHLQNKNDELILRWDNAPHHPELDNFPYHLHDKDDTAISGKLITLEEVLELIIN